MNVGNKNKENDEKEIRRHAVPRVRILTTNFYTVHYNLQTLTSHSLQGQARS